MEFNIILAGVGGQGILSIAQVLSLAAMRKGLSVKQAEVHGMAQRGGAVQAHLRVADHEIHSDTIPRGRANMILAIEPLEALRYVQFLAEDGIIVANTTPVVNIPNYGPIEKTLSELTKYPRHLLLDANRWAGAAGASRATNMAVLGAASVFLEIPPADLESAIMEVFASRGQQVIESNCTAFDYGRRAARAYRDALLRGADPRSIREWISTLTPAQLAEGCEKEFSRFQLLSQGQQTAAPSGSVDARLAAADERLDILSAGSTGAIDEILRQVQQENRAQLYEHEVYRILELIGAISPPQHVFVPRGVSLTPDYLSPFRTEKIALKLVSPEIVHKTDTGAVAFVSNDTATAARELDRLVAGQGERAGAIAGVLIVEFVDHGGLGFGRELFVGVRATREFGPVIAAGLGGLQTEYFAAKLKPGIAVAKALANLTSVEQFFELFKKTAAYDVLGGRIRGHRRIVSDGELLRCFRAFISIARRYCTHRENGGPELAELEVNPFAFRRETLIPLDGRGRLGAAAMPPTQRNLSAIDALLEPKSIAVLGVSGRRKNFGRLILNNTQRCGFPTQRLYVVKENTQQIDGVQCVPDIGALRETVDLLVMAAAAKDAPKFVEQLISSGKARSVILIPGGMGETEGTESVPAELKKTIESARSGRQNGPVFLGGNCLGVRSRPGRYDTFFIPEKKLKSMLDVPPSRAAFIAQSGGFIITRLSNWITLNPAFSISIGNQVDLTASDLLAWLGKRDDIDVIGVYIEGFKELDGLSFVTMVRRAADSGKTIVFYKAGKTEAGRSATAGHTASVAGDYDVCQAALEQAGAIVTETFKEFEQVMELATRMHHTKVNGRRLGVVSNAGFETVGMADAICGPRYEVEMATLADNTRAKLRKALEQGRLDTLVNVRNPLDLTPMACDATYEQCVRLMLDDENVDAVIAAIVPMTPAMKTTPDEIVAPDSIANRLSELFRETIKPLAVVVDCGPPYDELARTIRAAGIPVFPSSDQAVRSVGRYLCHRAAGRVSVAEDHGTDAARPSPTAERSVGV